MSPSRRNHRTWIPALVLAAVLGLGAGCGGGADAARPRPTTTSSTVSAAMTTTSTSVAPVVPTTRKVTPTSAKPVATTQVAPKVTVKDPEHEGSVDRFSNPGDAAGHLYDAWRTDDTAKALEVAAQAVVDDLFSYPVPQDPLASIGCEPVEVGFACRWAGERSRLVMIVEGGASAGYRVVWAAVHRPPVYEDGVPQVVVRPERAAVGARVRIDGYGFEGEAFSDPGAELYLVGGPAGCILYALAQHGVTVREDGYLVGEFVVPAQGECALGGPQAPVRAGLYYIGFGDDLAIIGELHVT